MRSGQGSRERWVARASMGGLLAVLCFLAVFSVVTERRVGGRAQRAEQATRISELFQDARFWVGQEESLEREYRLEPDSGVRSLHLQAEQRVGVDLKQLVRLDPLGSRGVGERLVELQTAYANASDVLLAAVNASNLDVVMGTEQQVVDPVFTEMQALVYGDAAAASGQALRQSVALRRDQTAATHATITAYALGLGWLAVFGLIIARYRRRLDGARAAEVSRLAEVALTDPLTGLRNHRAFHEDLERDLHRTARTGDRLALVMLDLDGLKQINDSRGHQAGDRSLIGLAAALGTNARLSDRAYRIGGDEFAVILQDTAAWGAIEFVSRLIESLNAAAIGATAGIAEGPGADKETLIREADLALIAGKRTRTAVSVYTPDMQAGATGTTPENEHHTQTLASALAVAVDAKDSYTRSHSQTVSQLCALIADALHFDADRLARVRLAGLLHDVGKIGIPDAILRKPTSLSDEEYRQMQTHSLLGHEIVAAADLSTEAYWVRHHHERYDGLGYPDGLAGGEIPLESRILLVADAFEAMTSDRPYRRAPGLEYALGELRRHAGTQFDPEIVEVMVRLIGESSHTRAADASTPPTVMRVRA